MLCFTQLSQNSTQDLKSKNIISDVFYILCYHIEEAVELLKSAGTVQSTVTGSQRGQKLNLFHYIFLSVRVKSELSQCKYSKNTELKI